MSNTESENLKGKVLSGLFWKFSERIAAQVVSLIVSIILARLLMPEDYGAVSLVTIFITIANVFVNDGFGVALIQKKDADNIDFSTVFYFGIFFSMILYGILYIAADGISQFYSMPILKPVLRVLSLRIIIAAVNSVQHAYVSRNMIFRKFFWSTLIGTIISAIVGILLAYSGFGVWALVFQYMTNTIIDTIVLGITVKWRPEKVFYFNRLKNLFKYGWKLLIQSLLVNIYANVRSLVIGKVYSSSDLAYYNKGSQFPNLIVTNVDTAINSAIFPAMSKEQQSKEKIKNMARRTTKLCSYVMSPLLIGFAACAESFVIFVLTEKWLPIVPFLRIICFTLLCRPAQTAMLQAIKSTGRSDVVLKMDIPVRILGLITLLVTLKFGVIYIAWSEFVVENFGCILYAFFCNKVIGYRIHEMYKDLGENIIEALLMGMLVFAVDKMLNIYVLYKLILEIFIGAIIYICISIILRNENFKYLLREIIKLKDKFKSRREVSKEC